MSINTRENLNTEPEEQKRRKALVEKAFKKVMRQAKKGGHLVIQLSVLAKQMDAVLAEMGGDDE